MDSSIHTRSRATHLGGNASLVCEHRDFDVEGKQPRALVCRDSLYGSSRLLEVNVQRRSAAGTTKQCDSRRGNKCVSSRRLRLASAQRSTPIKLNARGTIVAMSAQHHHSPRLNSASHCNVSSAGAFYLAFARSAITSCRRAQLVSRSIRQSGDRLLKVRLIKRYKRSCAHSSEAHKCDV